MTAYFGELSSEKRAIENAQARLIVKEIGDFGVSDHQRWLIIYLLALELENHSASIELTSCIKELMGNELFISSNGAENGTIIK